MALDLEKGVIELAHGSGGRATQELIEELILPIFDNSALRAGNDQALVTTPNSKIVVATDSHVVSPLFFPGGDIGALSVHGTINDIAVAGAKPLCLTCGLIIEEGFPLSDLHKILLSMAAAAKRCEINIVTGDTKVVEKGAADSIYINTTGIGVIEHHATLGVEKIREGDQIILSGTIGDHGMCIMNMRENLTNETNLKSDTAPLDGLVNDVMPFIDAIHCMRDPTRGGLAACLNELATGSGLGMRVDEASIHVHPQAEALSELMGVDPLYMANEGKLVAVVSPDVAEQVLVAMQANELGLQASIIGEVVKDDRCLVELNTCFGGKRLLDWRYSDPLPRIC